MRGIEETRRAVAAFVDALDVDADDALDTSLAKYRARLDETGSASSAE